jgi:hypothetical protein
MYCDELEVELFSTFILLNACCVVIVRPTAKGKVFQIELIQGSSAGLHFNFQETNVSLSFLSPKRKKYVLIDFCFSSVGQFKYYETP